MRCCLACKACTISEFGRVHLSPNTREPVTILVGAVFASQKYMRKQSVWVALTETVLIVNVVSGLSLSDLISDLDPLSISISNTAQAFEGWGTSLAWFAEYVGCLEGMSGTHSFVDSSFCRAHVTCADTYIKAVWQEMLEASVCTAGSQQEIVADMLFDADIGLGLEIVRYNIGGSNTTLNATNSMRPFAAVASMLLADGTYNYTLVGMLA